MRKNGFGVCFGHASAGHGREASWYAIQREALERGGRGGEGMAEIETKPEKRNFGKLLSRFVSRAKEKPVFSLAAFLVLAILAVAIFGTWAAPHDPLHGDPAGRLQAPVVGISSWDRCLGTVPSVAHSMRGENVVGARFRRCNHFLPHGDHGRPGGGLRRRNLRRSPDENHRCFLLLSGNHRGHGHRGNRRSRDRNLLLALCIVSWMRYARLVRGISLSARQRDYVQAARLSGVSHFVVIFRHILPASTPSLIVLSTIGLAKAIMAVSALGFLGFGVRPPYPEWGLLLMEGKDYILSAPHLSLYPGMAIRFPCFPSTCSATVCPTCRTTEMRFHKRHRKRRNLG